MAEKNYNELIKNRIYIGGAEDIPEVLKNEKIDIVFDLRAEAPKESTNYNRVHSPIVDDREQQDNVIKNTIDEVVDAYNEGKNIYVHCQGGSNRTGTIAIGTLLTLLSLNNIC